MATPVVARSRHALGVWWLLPIGFVTVASALEAGLAVDVVAWPASMPTFALFFSDYTHMKVWLACAALALATLQLLWAARMYRLLSFPPHGGFYNVLHRWAGRFALLLTLPIAYHCVIIIGLRPIDSRVLAHMIFGAFFYGVVVTKILIVRSPGMAGWLAPVVGGLLFTALLGLWLTSVPWWVSVYGLSF